MQHDFHSKTSFESIELVLECNAILKTGRDINVLRYKIKCITLGPWRIRCIITNLDICIPVFVHLFRHNITRLIIHNIGPNSQKNCKCGTISDKLRDK